MLAGSSSGWSLGPSVVVLAGTSVCSSSLFVLVGLSLAMDAVWTHLLQIWRLLVGFGSICMYIKCISFRDLWSGGNFKFIS